MNELTDLAKSYFQPYKNHIWKWADNGNVIESFDGNTVIYREELLMLLKGISTNGFPPLTSVLLVIVACQESWKYIKENPYALSNYILTNNPSIEVFDRDKLKARLPQTIIALNIIHNLPEELRTGAKKIHLLNEVFSEIQNTVIPKDNALSVLNEFSSGKTDEYLERPDREFDAYRFVRDMEILFERLRKCNDNGSLETKLRTGLEQVPDQDDQNIEIPTSQDLLSQLEEDSRTAGIARLTRKLIAALSIPMHAVGSSDQPIGGVSDITNRGNFDRLLLSELAYDDHLLAARLVNNEALYLRREEPPAHIEKERIILIDSSIKLWGASRVFALSVALACTKTDKHIGSIRTYLLGGQHFDETDISTKDGVISTLQFLDASLNCTDTFTSVMQEERPGNVDYVLISTEENIKETTFYKKIAEYSEKLNFLLTVGRAGELEFYEFHKGARKHRSSAKFDLEETLFKKTVEVKKHQSDDQPSEDFEFFKITPSPLFFPWTGNKQYGSSIFYEKEIGGILVTGTQRVLYWKNMETGAAELLTHIEKGDYCFGTYNGCIFILVAHKHKTGVKFYEIYLNSFETRKYNFETDSPVQDVQFESGSFYIKTTKNNLELNCSSLKIKEGQNIFKLNNPHHKPADLSIEKLTRINYSVLHRIKNITIKGGSLYLDNREIQILGHSNHIKISENLGSIANGQDEMSESFTLIQNQEIKFKKKVWPDGSIALLDNRGLLHLKSSDDKIPQIAILLILQRTTAAWSSDGIVCGSHFFIGKENPNEIKVNEFALKYIIPFISRIKQYGS